MLSAAAYQALVPNLETELLEQRPRAAEFDDEWAFTMLTNFRRDFIDTLPENGND
jgi:hypothetical protein